MMITIYGLGGYDTALPNNNIIEQYELPDDAAAPVDDARQSAMAKLLALGLTDQEIQALLS